jgi:hypothetical protein
MLGDFQDSILAAFIATMDGANSAPLGTGVDEVSPWWSVCGEMARRLMARARRRAWAWMTRTASSGLDSLIPGCYVAQPRAAGGLADEQDAGRGSGVEITEETVTMNTFERIISTNYKQIEADDAELSARVDAYHDTKDEFNRELRDWLSLIETWR